MKDLFQKNRDVIFINKRFTVNRFKKPLLMYFAVLPSGQSALVAFALYEKEEQQYF
jgi:hypothetical protein